MFFFPDTCRIHSTIPYNIPKASNVTWFSRNTKSVWFTWLSTGTVCVSRTAVCYISITATGSVNGPRTWESEIERRAHTERSLRYFRFLQVIFRTFSFTPTRNNIVTTIGFAQSYFSLRYQMLVSNICGILTIQNKRSGSKVTNFAYVI